MGKQLIIKGADFSQNSVLDELSIYLSSYFFPRKALGNSWGDTIDNSTRCCVNLGDLTPFTADYTKIKMVLRDGFDYVFALRTAPNSPIYYKGDGEVTEFAWVTDVNYVVAPLKDTLCINLRHKDNTTQFNAGAKISDIVKEIILFNP